MDAILFVLILEVVLLQMQILERRALQNVELFSASDKKKRHQRDKLSRDRILVTDVIRTTLLQVAEEGHYLALYQAVDILNQSSSTITSMQLNHDRLKTLIQNVKHQLITKRSHWELQLRNYDEKVASLKDEFRDSQLNAKVRLCFAEKYMYATAEVLELQYQIKPSPLPRPDHEQRVHTEILQAYEFQIKEREELLEYWKIKHNDDTTKIREQVIEQREKLRVTIARREELQKLFSYHAGEMRAWSTFKRERAARLAREERSRAAATRIQAWWRGLMVRRALGSFKHLKNTKKAVVKNKKK
ncbi:unnamed protein product [Parnassius mnemosyne]|uniref:Dynein regulatory complex protein 9 n=1 Tax=Parnassius mnemosyne TaxID=213953 RepID=A0AAV1M0R5_9NEOP